MAERIDRVRRFHSVSASRSAKLLCDARNDHPRDGVRRFRLVKRVPPGQIAPVRPGIREMSAEINDKNWGRTYG
jgi:hypothetical protein